MKQLLHIQARHLKVGDYIFDYKTRIADRVDYVGLEGKNSISGNITSVHISYGEFAMEADNFSPNDEVMILIDTSLIETRDQNVR